MVTFELVHEGIEGITQAEKVHSKEIGWHAHRHEKKKKNHGMFPDSNVKLKERGRKPE